MLQHFVLRNDDIIMHTARLITVILIYGLAASLAFAEEEQVLERIVVTPGADSLGPSAAKEFYSAQTLGLRQIEMQNPDSPPDLLRGISGMDLRYRSASGVQGDISLRDSTYEQVAVLIDGIKLNDPQTGHHNLDLPLTLYDIERLEVIKDGDSSLYGAGALAGSANFVLKRPLERSLKVGTLFGEHALFGESFSLTAPGRILSARVSYEHKVSKAARPNTDFRYYTASAYLTKNLEHAFLDLIFGYQKKDFGADSFYSNLFPEEEEHTETLFSKFGLENQLALGSLKNNLFFRRHRDKFILQRNNPLSVNYHTTYIYGLASRLNAPTRAGELILGLDLEGEEINSTNLGKHAFSCQAPSLGFIPRLPAKLEAEARLRVDHYRKWGWQESYNFGLEYALAGGLKINGSAGRSFRIPSFTELYYNTPANIGNPGLKVEESDNFKLGMEIKERGLALNIDGFIRRGRNLIDWTRLRESDPWQAANLGRVDFHGAEFRASLNGHPNGGKLTLQKAAFSYTYLDADKKASGFFSKYALDILKHQLLLDLYTQALGAQVNFQLSYNQRHYGETYFLGNLYIGKKFAKNGFFFEPFLKLDNFSNTKYSENPGVLLPGRWIKGGVKFEW